MDLDRVAAVIRPRSPWEAVDLGFGMVRAWWKPVWAAWFAIVAPAWWLIFSLTWWLTGEPLAAFLAAWWLRPFFDRVPLYVVSRHLFGTTPSIRNVLRDLPRLWTRHFWAGLLGQRLDPSRSFDLPVWELEGLRGSERSVRAMLLQRGSRPNAIWLTFACFTLEGLTMAAVFELASLLTPSSGWSKTFGASGEAAGSGDLTTAAWWWVAAVVFLAFSAIEPFYVAAGFSLYLSRRIHLEGWDVELAFRRLAARLAGGEPLRGRAGKAAAGVLLLALVLQPSAARGQDGGTKRLTPAQAVQEVLKEPELQTHKKMKVWRPKGDWDIPRSEAKKAPAPSSGVSLGFLQPLVMAVAVALLVVLVATAIGGMVRRPRHATSGDDEERRPPLPAAVFGLDIRPESLPADVPAAAWSAWERGDPALAMGLLYRSAIVFLVRHEGLAVRESWTEGDCVDFVAQKAGHDRAEYFRRLTQAWQSTAYAHRPPSTDEARALCSAWGRSFGAAT